MDESSVASLPMYDWPEVRWANDALWAEIAEQLRSHGLSAPGKLDREHDTGAVWTSSNLVLSQTCAWPFVTRLKGKVALLATPIYDVEGCAGGLYSSFLIARAEDARNSLGAFRGARFAINSLDSLSGYVALRSAMQTAGGGDGQVDWLRTGGHRESILAVSEERADVAAIDAVCWAMAGRHEAAAVGRLKVVGRTPLRPGLPFITARATRPENVAAIRQALFATLASKDTLAARRALFLAGAEIIEEADYAALAQLGRWTATQELAESRASRG